MVTTDEENTIVAKENVEAKRGFHKSPWTWVAVVIFAAFYVLSVLIPFPRFWHHLITNLMYNPLPIAAAIACFYAFRRVRRQR